MTDEFEQECRLLYEMGLKDSPLRLEYEEKVRDLSILREQMETEEKTKEQIAYFDNGGSFGDDPEIVSSMRIYIQENRRLLFEMNNVWHEVPNEITELFTRITAKPVGHGDGKINRKYFSG